MKLKKYLSLKSIFGIFIAIIILVLIYIVVIAINNPWIVLIGGVVIAISMAFMLSSFLIDRNKKKIYEESYKTILGQKQNFIFDGKIYNLKAEIRKGEAGVEPMIDTGSDNIKKIREIRKPMASMIKEKKNPKKGGSKK